MSEIDTLNLLENVDWDFKDYKIASSPNDINYLHWYPAPFIPQIPSIMIQLFSKIGDKILDPFCGSGVTLLEAAKQKRTFIGVDSNPFSLEIVNAKLDAVEFANDSWNVQLKIDIDKKRNINDDEEYCNNNGINLEVLKWYDKNTLNELLQIYDCLKRRNNENTYLLEKVIFSSVLYKVCSQREHYTYITDSCYPKEKLYYPAKELYLEQVEIIKGAADFFRNQFYAMHDSDTFSYEGETRFANSQSLDWIDDGDIDLIITSPPYLGVHDYNKSMRLTNNFYHNFNLFSLIENEMGSRTKRKRKDGFEEYIEEIKKCLDEFTRVLKDKGYFALVMGQGTGKVVKSDVVEIVDTYLVEELNLDLIYKKSRRVMFRRIQTPGITKEYIEIFKK